MNNELGSRSENDLYLEIGVHSFKERNGLNIVINSIGIPFEEGGNSKKDSVDKIIQSLLWDAIRDNLSWINDMSEQLRIIELIEDLSILLEDNVSQIDLTIKVQELKKRIEVLNISGKKEITTYIEERIADEDRPKELLDLADEIQNNINTEGRELYTVLSNSLSGKLIGIDTLDKKVTIEQLLETGKLKTGHNKLILVYQGIKEDILSLLEEEPFEGALPREGEN